MHPPNIKLLKGFCKFVRTKVKIWLYTSIIKCKLQDYEIKKTQRLNTGVYFTFGKKILTKVNTEVYFTFSKKIFLNKGTFHSSAYVLNAVFMS